MQLQPLTIIMQSMCHLHNSSNNMHRAMHFYNAWKAHMRVELCAVDYCRICDCLNFKTLVSSIIKVPETVAALSAPISSNCCHPVEEFMPVLSHCLNVSHMHEIGKCSSSLPCSVFAPVAIPSSRTLSTQVLIHMHIIHAGLACLTGNQVMHVHVMPTNSLLTL